MSKLRSVLDKHNAGTEKVETFARDTPRINQLKKYLDTIEDGMGLMRNGFIGISNAYDKADVEGKFNLNAIPNIVISELVDDFRDCVSDTLVDIERNIYESLSEGQHYSTKLRQVEGSAGTRKARMAIKEAKKMVENFLDTDHASPSPVGESDTKALSIAKGNLEEAIKQLHEAKVAKKSRG